MLFGRGFLSYKKKKEAAVAAHTANSAYTECRALICGYDPMNMLRSGTLIYCSHFVFLKCGDEIKRLLSPVVLRVAPGSDRDIIEYYILSPPSRRILRRTRLICLSNSPPSSSSASTSCSNVGTVQE